MPNIVIYLIISLLFMLPVFLIIIIFFVKPSSYFFTIIFYLLIAYCIILPFFIFYIMSCLKALQLKHLLSIVSGKIYKNWGGNSGITGRWHDKIIKISLEMGSKSETGAQNKRGGLFIRVFESFPFYCKIVKERGISKLLKNVIFIQDVKTGNMEFDNKYIVEYYPNSKEDYNTAIINFLNLEKQAVIDNIFLMNFNEIVFNAEGVTAYKKFYNSNNLKQENILKLLDYLILLYK